MAVSCWKSRLLLSQGQDKWKMKNEKNVKEVQKTESKEEYFIKNGGVLLEKQIALSQGKDIGAGQLKIFSGKATNNCDPYLILQSYRGSDIYKGTLNDEEMGLKIPQKPGSNPELVNNFLTVIDSFGVLMLELLTSRDPLEMAQCGTNLVDEFVFEVEKNGFNVTIDMILLEEDSMDGIQRFARLALKCVAKKGEERPSMINVVEELWLIQDQVNNKTGSKA